MSAEEQSNNLGTLKLIVELYYMNSELLKVVEFIAIGDMDSYLKAIICQELERAEYSLRASSESTFRIRIIPVNESN
jgi:hypothetical protein